MPIEVELPDGTVAEFPDGTSREAIQKALRNQSLKRPAAFKPPAQAKPALRDQLAPYGGTFLMDMLDAGQHHVLSQMNGLGQLIHHGVTKATELLPEGNSIREWAHEIDRKGAPALAQREADYQHRVPTNAASLTGAVAGEVLPWMTGIGELRAAGLLPQIPKGVGLLGKAAEIGKKGGLLALEGGTMQAAQPVLEDGSYGAHKGAQVAVGMAAAPLLAGGFVGADKLAGGAGRLARYATSGGREAIANERLAKLYGSDAEILQKLRADTGVPGFDLTPAQALATPEAVQAERLLRNHALTAPAFAGREAANNAAAQAQVARVAGDDAALEAAHIARREAVAPYRSKIPETGSPMVPAQEVFSQLERLSLSANPTIRGTAREHLALLKKQADKDGNVPAFALDDIRQNAGSMLAKHTPARGGSVEAARYGPVTDTIADALDRAVPGYRDYLATYARASEPINDMEAGKALLAAIGSGGRDAGGGQAVTLNQVKALLAKDNRANFPMSESARKQIEAVLEVLQQRSVTNNTIAAAGPGSAADLQKAVQASPLLMRILGHSASVGGGVTLGPLGYLAGAAATEGANAANNSVVRKLGEKAASAKSTADAIEAFRLLQEQKQKAGLLSPLLPYEKSPFLLTR